VVSDIDVADRRFGEELVEQPLVVGQRGQHQGVLSGRVARPGRPGGDPDVRLIVASLFAAVQTIRRRP
jgi:hypothetical protein